MKSQKTVFIAAGGTGGHIYPALAIAQALLQLDPQIQIEFIGTAHGLENKLIPREGFKIHHIAVGRLNKNVRAEERLLTLLRLPFALLQAMWLVLSRRPILVLGVGGYVTGPILLVAALLRKKTFLWEPNAHPGMANRWLAPFVFESLVVFDEAAQLLRTKRSQKVGMPVRAQIAALSGKPEAEPYRGQRPLRVLVFGGSQGARAINDVVSQAILEGGEWLDGVEVIHQTGPNDFARIQHIYASEKRPVEVFEYLHDMQSRYAWADVVIARAGASTVAEIAACGKAAVLIPLPTAADNHQQKNAEVLANHKAAIMILQRELTTGRFKQLIADFKGFPDMITKLSQNVRQFHLAHADHEIARHLLESIQ